MCEQLAQGCYAALPRVGFEPASRNLLVASPTPYPLHYHTTYFLDTCRKTIDSVDALNYNENCKLLPETQFSLPVRTARQVASDNSTIQQLVKSLLRLSNYAMQHVDKIHRESKKRVPP